MIFGAGLDPLGLLAQIAREGLDGDQSALDEHKAIGQRLVVAAGQTGEDQIANGSRNGERADLELLNGGRYDWCRTRRVRAGCL